MRVIIHILFVSFFVLTVCPTVRALNCNKKMTCSDLRSACESEKTCENEKANDCPIKMCNACPCCFCCSVCPVENKKIEIKVFCISINNNLAADQYILSDFVAD